MNRKQGFLECYFVLLTTWFITAWVMLFFYMFLNVDLGIIKALEGIDNNIVLLAIMWSLLCIPEALFLEFIDYSFGFPLGLYKSGK